MVLIILGALMIIPVTGSAPLWLAAVAWAIAGAGIGLAYPGFSLAALSSTTEGSEGAAATSVKTAEFLAAAGGAGIARRFTIIRACRARSKLFMARGRRFVSRPRPLA